MRQLERENYGPSCDPDSEWWAMNQELARCFGLYEGMFVYENADENRHRYVLQIRGCRAEATEEWLSLQMGKVRCGVATAWRSAAWVAGTNLPWLLATFTLRRANDHAPDFHAGIAA
jgi:hypothetical protein